MVNQLKSKNTNEMSVSWAQIKQRRWMLPTMKKQQNSIKLHVNMKAKYNKCSLQFRSLPTSSFIVCIYYIMAY